VAWGRPKAYVQGDLQPKETAMHKRPLGRSGIEIAPVMFGGNVFEWTTDEATSFALLDQFVDAGFNAIDTSRCLFRMGSWA
jgi:hypothetical protein